MKQVMCLRAITAVLTLFLALHSHGAYAQQVSIQAEDYGAARAAFSTRLVIKSRAPQNYQPAKPRPDVTVAEFPAGDLKLKIWIGIPKERRPRMPAVLFLHGGFAFGESDFDMAQPFRDAGFVVAMPILRGENGQPGAFSMFYDEVDDVLAAAEFLRKQDYVDGSRIFIAGHSVGGTLALLAGMASPVFKGIASYSGSPDQILFAGSGPLNKAVPFDQSNPKEWEMRSPLAYAGSLKAPTRLFFGSEEAFFRMTTLKLAAAAKAKGVDAVAEEMTGNHFSHVPAAINKSILFFRSLN